MYKIVYIIPYFGKMRGDFNIWLKSCSYNSTIDFLIFTDDGADYNYPPNVQVHYLTFAEMKTLIESKLRIPVNLNRPYKLCDFKPAYGIIFEDYLDGYDFWGHCDVDMIWGDIRKFFTNDILSGYEKVGFLGHSTLYKNDSERNKRYELEIDGESINFKTVFNSSSGFHFDENYMNRLYHQSGWPVFKKVNFADLTEYKYNFFLTNVSKDRNYDRQIFTWENGHLKRHYIDHGELKEDEFLYIHFLKREMELQIKNIRDFKRLVIYPNTITDADIEINSDFIRQKGKPHWIKYFIHLFAQKKHTITLSKLPVKIWRRIKKYYLLANKNALLNDNENY